MTAFPVVPTPRVPVTTTYHGVAVTEEYRWLEDASSEETIRWTEAQQARTRAYLDAIGWRPALRARVEELMRDASTRYVSLGSGGELFFALKEQRPRQRPMLVSLTDLDDPGTESVVLDPLEVDPSGETTIDWFVPSPDGRRVAVSLSEHGNEDGTLHVYDVATGEHVGAPIPHVNVMGGSMTWRHDSDGIWYTLPADVGFRQQVWFRDLDTGTDTVELTGPFADAQIAENFLSSSPDGRWVMDRVQKGDGGEWQIFVRGQDAGSAWWQAADIPDRCVYAVLGEEAVYLLSRLGTPRGRILRLPLTQGATVSGAETIVPAGEHAIDDLAVTTGTVWVVDLDGGPQQVRRFDPDGQELASVEIPPVSSVSSYGARLTRLRPDLVAWSGASFTAPGTWWVTGDGGTPGPTALRTTTSVDLSGYVVTREMATSKDGTLVPISIISAPDTPRDGSAPALLVAYGGYGISLVPMFNAERVLWLEQGGVYAVANIRGGGEYGEEWHQGGRLTTKQNCFDDFIACAEHLAIHGITSHDRLAILGGSNGGLLMGAVLTQRPDIARAVVAAVPVLDSLRSETSTNGVYNVTEFGTVADPEHFAALLAYSPYHHVADQTSYPAVLLTAGEHDTRVDAWHAKKMAARLQAATRSEHPVLLRMEAGGHLDGSLDQMVEESTDIYSFLFDQLGLGYAAP
ncbi:prolyl oligopeptidase family serine peptidase [Nocardioides sp.]|jgi:prolyl oligopeptidase|uniref:prolyl oligopeptidase family serine peptidase n=1 Tax=Nocardioides sp. TaxID=35761 RepID=UPI002F401100